MFIFKESAFMSKRNRLGRTFSSILLSLCMIVTMMPAMVFAETTVSPWDNGSLVINYSGAKTSLHIDADTLKNEVANAAGAGRSSWIPIKINCTEDYTVNMSYIESGIDTSKQVENTRQLGCLYCVTCQNLDSNDVASYTRGSIDPKVIESGKKRFLSEGCNLKSSLKNRIRLDINVDAVNSISNDYAIDIEIRPNKGYEFGIDLVNRAEAKFSKGEEIHLKAFSNTDEVVGFKWSLEFCDFDGKPLSSEGFSFTTGGTNNCLCDIKTPTQCDEGFLVVHAIGIDKYGMGGDYGDWGARDHSRGMEIRDNHLEGFLERVSGCQSLDKMKKGATFTFKPYGKTLVREDFSVTPHIERVDCHQFSFTVPDKYKNDIKITDNHKVNYTVTRLTNNYAEFIGHFDTTPMSSTGRIEYGEKCDVVFQIPPYDGDIELSFDGINMNDGVNVFLSDADAKLELSPAISHDIGGKVKKVEYVLNYEEPSEDEECPGEIIKLDEQELESKAKYSVEKIKLAEWFDAYANAYGDNSLCTLRLEAAGCDEDGNVLTTASIPVNVYERKIFEPTYTDMEFMPGYDYKFEKDTVVYVQDGKVPEGAELSATIVGTPTVVEEEAETEETWYDISYDAGLGDSIPGYVFKTNYTAQDGDTVTLNVPYKVKYEDGTTAIYNHRWTVTVLYEFFYLVWDGDSELAFTQSTSITPGLEYIKYDKELHEPVFQDISDAKYALEFEDSDLSGSCYTTAEPTGTIVGDDAKWTITAKSADDFRGYTEDEWIGGGEDRYNLTVTLDPKAGRNDEIKTKSRVVNVYTSQSKNTIERKDAAKLIRLVSKSKNNKINSQNFVAYNYCYNFDEGAGTYKLTKEKLDVDRFNFDRYLWDTFTENNGYLVLNSNTEHEDCYTSVYVAAEYEDDCIAYGDFRVLINPTATLIVPKGISVDASAEKAEADIISSDDVSVKVTKGTVNAYIEEGKLVIKPNGIGHSEVTLTVPDSDYYKGTTKSIPIEVTEQIAGSENASIGALDEAATAFVGQDLSLVVGESKTAVPQEVVDETDVQVPLSIELKKDDEVQGVKDASLLVKVKMENGVEELTDCTDYKVRCIDEGEDTEASSAWIEDGYICFTVNHLSNYVLTGMESEKLSGYKLDIANAEYKANSNEVCVDATLSNDENVVPTDAYTLNITKDGAEGKYLVKAVAVPGAGYSGETEQVAIEVTGHRHAFEKEWFHDDKTHWRSCTHDGCEMLSDPENHRWDNGVVNARTYVRTYTCKDCGYTRSEKLTFSFRSSKLPLKKKQTVNAVANVIYSKTDGVKSITYGTSSSKKYVKISGTKIKGIKKGTATIKVTLKSGLTKSFKIKVQKKKVTGKISLGCKTKVTLKRGQTLSIKASKSPITCTDKLKYSSSKKSVATVSSSGKITAKKKGSAKIYVKCGKTKKTIKVTVK